MAGKYDALAEEFAPAPVPAAPPVPANDVAPAPAMPAAPPAEPDLSGALAPSPMAEPAPVPVSDLTPAPFNPNIPPSKYDGLVAEETVLQQPKVIAALLAAKEADPALYERAEKLIGGDERMQLPAEMVARNIETLEQQQRITKLRETLSENPQLAEWFGRGANSKLVTVDELKHTTGLAWLFKSSAAAFSSGWQDTTSNYTRYDQMMGVANPDDVAAADRFTRTREADPEAQKFGADGWLESGWVGLAGSVIPMIDQLGRGAARGVQYGAVGALGGAGVGAMGGPVGVGAGAAFGARAGFAVGNLAGQYEAAFKQGAGMAWDEFRQFRGTDGKQLDPETAKSAALVSGAIEGVINVWGTQKVLEQIPGLDILAGAGVRNVVKSVLESPTQRELLTKYAKQIGGNAGLVALVPVLTEATRELVGAYTKSDANAKGGTFEQKNAGDIAGRLYEAGIAGLQMGTILAPALAIPGFRRDLSNAKMAEQHATVIADIIARSAEDKLVARLPNKAAELVAALKADTGISEIHVPADKLREVFQSVDGASWMDNLERHLPEGRLESFQEAIASGGDIPIAIETFYAHLAPRYGEALAPHVRMDKDGATQFEAATFNDAWQETMAALGTEEATRAKLEREAGAPANQVFTDVRDRLMSSGFAPQHADHYATIYGSFFRTLADKTGMDAKSLYDRYGFDVRRVMPEVQEFAKVDTLDVNLGAMQRFAKAFVSDKGGVTLSRASERRGNLLDFIVGRGGLFDEGGDVRSRDGHLYRRGKLIAKVDPDTGRPLDKYGNIDSKYETGVDDTATAAWEAGYFPELTEPPTRIELLNAIEDGLSGNHRFNQEKVDIRNQGSFNARQGEMLKHMLETSSLSMEEIATLPIPELRRLLEERAAEEDAGRPAPDRETVMDPLLARELDDFLEAATGSRELFQFAGENARTIDADALGRAKRMAEEGMTPETLYEETGFFQGKDGAWRFEISDADARFMPSTRLLLERTGRVEGKLGGIIDHPKLFAAYPEMRNIDVELVRSPKESGYWAADKLKINAEGRDLEVIRSVVLHEVAHAIQDAEGFARGGNLTMGEMYSGPSVEAAQQRVNDLEERLKNAYADGHEPTIRSLSEEVATAERQLVRLARYEYYSRIAGEVEARNVEKRAKLQPKVDERNANWDETLRAEGLDPSHPDWEIMRGAAETLAAPWLTQDVANADQIVILRSAGREGYAAHVGREPEPAPPRELFQSQTGDVRKGSLQIMDGEHLVSLFEKADLSTFLHETGHFFLEVYRDLAARGEMPDAVRADWDKISAYLELTGDEIPTVAHEKFARTFEAYLFEGKAPSADLASAFNRFKSWLGFVYRKITSLGVEPNDEIRGVLDRMLASDAEIEAQTRSAEYKPLPDELNLMNKEEREKYLALVEVAKEQAREALTRKTLAEVARETSKEWRDQKAAIREEVTDEFSQMPVYQAVEFIRTGKFIGADGDRFGDIGMMKLDKDALLSMYGPGILQKLPRAVPPLYVNKGGVHPDVIAELFGYQSGHQMVEAMMSAPPFRRAVVDEVNARMKARHGDLMNDQAAMSAAAVDALHEGDRAPILRAEYEALAKRSAGSSPKTLTPLMMMRDAARDIIGRKNIAEATRVATYDGQEARAARRVEQALAAGDFKTAAEWKQKQLFAHVLAQEARRAKTDTQKAADYLNRFTGNKRPPSVDPGYLDQIDAILERFDLRKGVGDTRLARERRKSLQEFLNEEELAGEMLSIDEAFKSDAYRQHFREMAVDDFRALADTIKNLEHVGKLKNKLLVKGKLIAFETARDEFTAAVKSTRKARKVQANQSKTMGDKIAGKFASADAALLKIEQIVEWVDSGDVHGPFRRLVWEPIKEARARELDMQVDLTSKMIDVLHNLPKGRLGERFNIKSVNPDFHMTRAEIYGVALNMGTESNLSKLKRGGNQHGEFTDAHLADMVAHLSKEDWEAVNKIWQIVGSLWPDIAAQQKRMTGLEPEKVEARKVVTPHGVFDGGYFPLVYDTEKPGTLDVAQRADVNKLMPGGSPNRPVTAHGFTKARVENYARPIKLDLQVIPEHLKEVIHDLSFRETLRDAFKLLNDKQVVDAFERHYGREVVAEFVPWLQSIARDGTPLTINEAIDNLAKKARTNATIFGIGYRLTTVLAQPAGYFSSMEMVSPVWMAKAMRMYFGSPAKMAEVREMVHAKSGEMRHRETTMDRDLGDAIRSAVEGKGVRRQAGRGWWASAIEELAKGDLKGTGSDVMKFAFHGISWMDRNVTIPTWLAAYHEHLAKNPGDEKGAIANGDRVVRLSQGSGSVEDLARVSRGTEVGKMMTTFYSYWSAFYNRARNLGVDASNAGVKDVPALLGRAMMMWAVPALMGDLLTGKGPDEKKEESALSWGVKKVLLYPFMALPGVREAASMVEFGPNVSPSPIGRITEAAGRVTSDAVRIAAGKDVERGKVIRHAVDAVGMIGGLPISQIGILAENIFTAIDKNGGQFAPRDIVFPQKR